MTGSNSQNNSLEKYPFEVIKINNSDFFSDTKMKALIREAKESS
jgi:hypothetical protein